MNKTVAIIGSHPGTRDKAPWDDKNIDIWVFNAGAIAPWCKRADAVFEMHMAGEYTNPMAERSEYWHGFLTKQIVATVWMRESDPRVPACKVYPLKTIVDLYLSKFKRGSKVNQYFTSSPCYAIAMAIYLGYKKIILCGIEMETNSEYIYQRDGVGLWVGIALGAGVGIEIAETSSMFNAPLYGYDQEDKGITREELEDNENELVKQFDAANLKLNETRGRLDGVIVQIEEMKKNGEEPAKIAAMGESYGNYTHEYEQAIANVADINGRLNTVRFFKTRLEKIMIANGQAQQVMAMRNNKIRASGFSA